MYVDDESEGSVRVYGEKLGWWYEQGEWIRPQQWLKRKRSWSL